MPRSGRLVLPGYPHHIVQRGHNRQVIFAEDRDYNYYLNTLKAFKDECGVKVYAYCLMTNHVHLLLEPESVSGLAALMKRLAGRQTRFFNCLENRRGSLWEGRYKSSVVDTEHYLLRCIRYIEQNPVKARMVENPSMYLWSSYQERYRGECNLLSPLPDINLSGAAYAEYICSAVPADEEVIIRNSLARNQLTGDSRFIDEIERITGERVEKRGQGRPRKEKVNEKYVPFF